jgi:hypothetical protein
LLLLGAIVAAFSVAGCGGGGGDSITVQTGSLTKAEFVTRANAACAAARIQFEKAFAQYDRTHELKNAPSEEAWLEGIIEKAVLPNYEQRMIDQISTIGAPAGEKQEVVEFLESLRQRLNELKEEPKELNKTPFPFAKTAALAKKYGFKGCAESFG